MQQQYLRHCESVSSRTCYRLIYQRSQTCVYTLSKVPLAQAAVSAVISFSYWCLRSCVSLSAISGHRGRHGSGRRCLLCMLMKTALGTLAGLFRLGQAGQQFSYIVRYSTFFCEIHLPSVQILTNHQAVDFTSQTGSSLIFRLICMFINPYLVSVAPFQCITVSRYCFDFLVFKIFIMVLNFFLNIYIFHGFYLFLSQWQKTENFFLHLSNTCF